MSDTSWILRGIDAETRQRAVEESERLGMSLSDYLTQVLLGGGEPETDSESEAIDLDPALPLETVRENFAFRHRLDALERRLSLAIGGLDSALHAMDSTVLGMAGRLDETEALAADTADSLEQTISELGGNVSAMRKRLADAEDGLETLTAGAEATDAELVERCDLISARLENVAQIARNAEAAGQALNAAQEALQHALAQDFNDFAEENDARIAAATAELRTIADDAARHADEAVARALEALRTSREAMEQNLDDHAAEVRGRMHAAFSDAAERLASLAERVVENERAVTRTHEQLAGRIIDVEDGAQLAIEETAESLRAADTALRAELSHVRDEARDALEAAQHEFNNELTDLAERQLGGQARLKLVDAAVNSLADDLASLTDRLETRFTESVVAAQAAQSKLEVEFRSSVDRLQTQANYTQETFGADIARVEACTFASLEKLAADIANGASALRHEIGDVRDLQAGALARLKLIDRALNAEDLVAASEAGTAPVSQRLRQLEHAIRNAESAQALAALNTAVEALAGEIGENRRSTEQLAAHVTRTEQHLTARVDQTEERLSAWIEDIEERLSSRVMQTEGRVDTRLTQSEERLSARTEQNEAALATLQQQVEIVGRMRSADETLVQRVEELRTRLGAHEAQASETTDRVHGIARMLGRLTAQNADASTQSEERLHRLELAFADLRLEGFTPTEAGGAVSEDLLRATTERIAEMEERQAAAFETLRADIAHFIGENDRRLAALEQGGAVNLTADEVLIAHAVESRLTAIEQRDVSGEFEALRRRVEERILSVEGRSVRALEQVAETVALIERRMVEADSAIARSA